MNMNMSAMTVFLDIGCGMLAGKQGEKPAAVVSPCCSLDRSSLATSEIPSDEYQNLVISFQDSSDTRTGAGKRVDSHFEPQPELIGLLNRLKYRYCLQIAVMGLKLPELGHPRIGKPDLACIADYYITKSNIGISDSLGMQWILHVDYFSTRTKLESFGLWDA